MISTFRRTRYRLLEKIAFFKAHEVLITCIGRKELISLWRAKSDQLEARLCRLDPLRSILRKANRDGVELINQSPAINQEEDSRLQGIWEQVLTTLVGETTPEEDERLTQLLPELQDLADHLREDSDEKPRF